MPSLLDQIGAWTRAELNADTQALAALLHPDFIGIGPYGFVLDRDQWLDRFTGGLAYTAFAFDLDLPVRELGETAVAVGTQRQAGTHRGRPIDGEFRVTHIFTGDEHRLLGLHLSLRAPPS